MDGISPVGSTIEEHIRELEAVDPELRERRARTRPHHDAAFAVIGLRARHGLTQEELARRVGTTKSAISRLESGRHKPNVDTLNRVARAFGKRLVISFEDADEGAQPGGLARHPRAASQ